MCPRAAYQTKFKNQYQCSLLFRYVTHDCIFKCYLKKGFPGWEATPGSFDFVYLLIQSLYR
jgi:hypothetical protein